MNLYSLKALLLSALILSVVSCGKKARDDESPDSLSSIAPTLSQQQFNALKYLKNGLRDNDLALIEKAFKTDPELNVNQIMDDGDTPLISSIKSGYRNIRNYFIDHGANLNKANVLKETPIIIAVKYKKINSVQVLLDYKVKVDERDSDNNVALHYALKNNDGPTALLLVKQGANIQLTDSEDRNAYQIAIDQKLFDVADIIKGLMIANYNTPDISTFKSLITLGDVKGMKMMLDKFPNVVVDYQLINPLNMILSTQDLNSGFKMAELLLINHIDPNGPIKSDETPLIKATKTQRIDFSELYLTYKANPDLTDAQGKSALIYAVELNQLELVELLLKYSAKVKYTTNVGANKINFNACKTANITLRTLKNDLEKENMKQIKKLLSCSIWDWF